MNVGAIRHRKQNYGEPRGRPHRSRCPRRADRRGQRRGYLLRLPRDVREKNGTTLIHGLKPRNEDERPWAPPRAGLPVERREAWELATHGARAGLLAGLGLGI